MSTTDMREGGNPISREEQYGLVQDSLHKASVETDRTHAPAVCDFMFNGRRVVVLPRGMDSIAVPIASTRAARWEQFKRLAAEFAVAEGGAAT